MFIEPDRLPDGDKEILSIGIWCESNKLDFMTFLKKTALNWIRNFEQLPATDQTMILAFDLKSGNFPLGANLKKIIQENKT